MGRLDGLVSTAASVNGKLPQPTFNLNQLNALFAANGLSQTDMIALSGMTQLTLFLSSGSHVHTRERIAWVQLTGTVYSRDGVVDVLGNH